MVTSLALSLTLLLQARPEIVDTAYEMRGGTYAGTGLWYRITHSMLQIFIRIKYMENISNAIRLSLSIAKKIAKARNIVMDKKMN